MSKLYLVGIGPGSGRYLTFEAINAVESSDLVIGSKRAIKLFAEAKAEKIEFNASNMQEMLNLAVSKACEGRKVALLSTGDPGFSGLLQPVKRLAGKLDLDVIPGISSIQICASKLQIPWDEANILTMHGKGISNELMPMLSNGRATFILPNSTIKETVNYMLDQGISPERRAVVCENLTYDNERIVKAKLEDLLAESFGYMCILVVYEGGLN